LKLKEYERNWKQKNMKAIGTKIKWNKFETK
jgi:hypothetical protein